MCVLVWIWRFLVHPEPRHAPCPARWPVVSLGCMPMSTLWRAGNTGTMRPTCPPGGERFSYKKPECIIIIIIQCCVSQNQVICLSVRVLRVIFYACVCWFPLRSGSHCRLAIDRAGKVINLRSSSPCLSCWWWWEDDMNGFTDAALESCVCPLQQPQILCKCTHSLKCAMHI